MNNQRRKEIEAIVKVLTDDFGMEDLRGKVDDLQSEEQEAFDGMPESLQQSDRGQASETAADALQTAYDAIDAAITSLEEAVNALEEAKS